MATLSFLRRVETLATLLEPQRGRLYRYVAEQERPVSRDDAAAALEITRAMAAFHLDKLVDAGLLRAEYKRVSGRTGRGAGRPAKLYRRSRRRFDVSLPTRDHQLLARLLLEAGGDRRSKRSLDDAAGAYGRSLGARARTRVGGGESSGRLVHCVEEAIAHLGFQPERHDGGLWTRNCPFDPLSRRFPDVVCGAAVAMARGVVEGARATDLTVRREDRADWCCVVVEGVPRPEPPIERATP